MRLCMCKYRESEREREREREREMIKKKLDRQKLGVKRREGRYLRREADGKGVTVGLEKTAMGGRRIRGREGKFSDR
jgi:hypothetical protein